MVLSCMALTDPVEITVVTMLQNPEAAAPIRISFPSIAPNELSIPIADIAGLPFISMIIFGTTRNKKPTVITPNIIRESRFLPVKYPNAKIIAIGITSWANISTGVTGANVSVYNNLVYNITGDWWDVTTVPTDNPIGLAVWGTQDGVSLYYNSINPLMGVMPGLKAFVAAVFGGIGLIPGALLGAYVIGSLETFVASAGYSMFRDAVVFAVLIGILMVKPTGLLGKNLKEKV